MSQMSRTALAAAALALALALPARARPPRGQGAGAGDGAGGDGFGAGPRGLAPGLAGRGFGTTPLPALRSAPYQMRSGVTVRPVGLTCSGSSMIAVTSSLSCC